MVNRSRRRTNKSKPRRARSTTRSTRAPRKSTTRSRRAPARKSRREQARERRGSTTRRASKASRRTSKASRRTSKASKRRADVVSDVLSSTLGLGDMFKDDEKGYTKRYRVNKKAADKESSEGYDLDKVFKENERGYKGQIVNKKRKGAARPPKIPRNKRGKKVKSDDSDVDSFLAGIESSGNKKRRAKPAKRSKKGASPYNKFVKEQSPIIKAENPGLTQPEIMKLIGKKWKEQKP